MWHKVTRICMEINFMKICLDKSGHYKVMNIYGGSVYPELGNMSSYLVNKYQ